MKRILYFIGLICMAIFLFVIHTKYLNVLENWKDSDMFNFMVIDFRQILHYIISATFAVMVTNILALMDPVDKWFWKFVFIVATAEFLAVFLFFNTTITEDWFRILSSIYYGLYIFMIIPMYAYIKKYLKIRVKIKQQPKISRVRPKSGRISTNKDKVMELHEKGVKPVKIAKKLELNNSTVYRILKKNVQKYETIKG